FHPTHCKLRFYDFKFAIFPNSFFDNRITDNLGCLIRPMLYRLAASLKYGTPCLYRFFKHVSPMSIGKTGHC
ncbi:MAG TPA: hypothetical protein VI727_09260, partial [Candidatus Brocadiaceae bacterium]|nr:hypothetical protein [Candidatus Brocadiaceae bacterium]